MCKQLNSVMNKIQSHAILCALVALSILLMLQPASAQIFYADFEDGSSANDPAQWVADNTGQNWGIADFPGSGKGLKNLNEGCGTSGNTPLPGVDNFQDGIIQLDMSWEDDDSFGVVFRKTADDAGYLVVFGYIETPGVIVADLADGCADTGLCLSDSGCENGGLELIQVDHGFGTNLTQDLSVSYTGRIEVKGDTIRVWFLPTADIPDPLDPLGDLGVPLVEIQNSAHLGPGSVGIWQESAGGCMIDNVLVAGIGSQPLAWGPNPPVGDLLTDTWANLSWRPGDFALSHDVYIGDNFDAVNEGAEGTFIGNQAGTSILAGFPGFPVPDGLMPGTTYYWRVDEVNDANALSPWKGNIWNFSIQPYTAYEPEPADGAFSVALDAILSWTPGFGTKLHHVYFGDNLDDVTNAAGNPPWGKTTYDPGPLEMAKTYYWRVDEFDAIQTYKGDVWSFTTEGGVETLSPSNGAVDITQTPVLTWAPGLGATHEVYFGADAASLELKASGNLGSESFEPGQLEWDTTYYWRVDEVNNTNANSPWTGPLWSFTTANFLIIDDMEAYNDLDEGDPASNRIYLAWLDGFGDPTNGSLVGYENPPFAELSIVHGGSQSMPFAYDNAPGKSEAT
ncbi:MAG: hypothetical protein RQ760_21905, partial [Sedimentisphaerales bacterium]|nr:hypothetical protein [Sedimentisphaerales bacterium]